MKWNKDKMRETSKKGFIPSHYFEKDCICPICSEKVNPREESFDATGKNPYVRFFDKLYWIHKECFFVLYEGMDITVNENKDEYMVEEL